MTIDLWRGFQAGVLAVREPSASANSTAGHNFLQVLERLPVAACVYALDEAGSVVLVNEPFVRTFGYTRDDIPTLHDWAVKAYPDAAYRQEASAAWDAAVARAHAKTGRVEELELRVVCKDGTVRDIAFAASVIDRFLMATFSDITRHKQAERSLRFATERMRLAAAREQERRQEETHRRDLERKLKTSLSAAAAAHEIKQPLSRILLETQLTIERLKGREPDSADLWGYLQTVLAESQHVVDMVSRMKALLRNVESKQGPVEVGDVVAGAILHARRYLASHGVRLHEAGLDGQGRIHGDGVQVQAAVSNLIRNAVEAVAQGEGQRREVAVTITAAESGVTIVVGDSGPGMPDDVVANLPLVTSKPDGTGLGLYLVRTCMENHGGAMTIGRSPLGGAEVRLSFPPLESRA